MTLINVIKAIMTFLINVEKYYTHDILTTPLQQILSNRLLVTIIDEKKINSVVDLNHN